MRWVTKVRQRFGALRALGFESRLQFRREPRAGPLERLARWESLFENVAGDIGRTCDFKQVLKEI